MTQLYSIQLTTMYGILLIIEWLSTASHYMPHQGSSENPTATSLKQKGESWMAQEILKFKKNSLYLGNNTLIGMLIGSQVSSSETDTWWRPSWVIWRGRLSYQKYLAVKCAVPHEECGWGTHLPYLGREPVGGLLPKSVTCCHLDTRPFQPQSISTSGIELYCLMTTEARVQTSCPQLSPESGIEPATFGVACPTPRPLHHQTTKSICRADISKRTAAYLANGNGARAIWCEKNFWNGRNNNKCVQQNIRTQK